MCTYFNSGIGEKVRTLMHLMERNPAEYKIKEGADLEFPSLSLPPPPRPPSGTSSSTGMVYSPPVPYVEVSKIGGGFFKVRREHTFRLSRMFASHTMARECRRFSRLRIFAELSFISIAIAYQTTANSRNSEKCNFMAAASLCEHIDDFLTA